MSNKLEANPNNSGSVLIVRLRVVEVLRRVIAMPIRLSGDRELLIQRLGEIITTVAEQELWMASSM
jgi:hypothetical protein